MVRERQWWMIWGINGATAPGLPFIIMGLAGARAKRGAVSASVIGIISRKARKARDLTSNRGKAGSTPFPGPMEKLIQRLYREMLRGTFARKVEIHYMLVTPWHETLLGIINGTAPLAIANLYSKKEAEAALLRECRMFVESTWVEGMTWEGLLPLATKRFGKA